MSVRCFVRDLKLLTVTDHWGVKGTELILETVWKLLILQGGNEACDLWLFGQLFKLRGIVPAPRLFQQRSVISANAVINSSELALFYRPEGEKGNHPPLSVTSQTILWKSLITSLGHFFPNLSHLGLQARRVVQFQNLSCRQKFIINGKYCTSSHARFFKYHSSPCSSFTGQVWILAKNRTGFSSCDDTDSSVQHTFFFFLFHLVGPNMQQ